MTLFTPLLAPQAKASSAANRPGARLLQRACDCEGKSSGGCDSCGKKKLQRKAGAGAVPTATPGALAAAPQLTQGGAALGAGLTSHLGPLFGSDFGSVRLHHDATSAAAAREVGARAFTLGQHVHFGAGQWRPQERSGLHLLAHELSHTLQGAQGSAAGEGVQIDDAASPLEHEADSAADAVLAGRAVRVRGAGGSGISRKLLQRAPNLDATSGIGTAAGGSDTASVDRRIDEFTSTHITRTLTEPPCEQVKKETATPNDKIFYWDKKADAIGFKYSSCNGKVQLGTSGKIDYTEVEKSATGLLTTLQNNPALGANFGTLLQNRLDAAPLKASGDITVTVDGILQAGIEATSTAGTSEQAFTLHGKVKITPKGMAFVLDGGVDLSRTPLKTSTSYKVEIQGGTETFHVALNYEHIDQRNAGGPSNTQEKAGFFLGTGSTSAGVQGEKSPGLPPTALFVFKHDFDLTPTPKVDCYECKCPPPQPEFACARNVQAHKVEDKPADDRPVRLTYQYNSATPANDKDYDAGLNTIADLVKSGYSVARIWGYASPEGSLDAPAHGGNAFKGNQALSQERANVASSRIQGKVPGTTLAAPEGHGELLGSLGSGPDTPDKELTPDLVALLKDKTPDERLDALGVSQQTLDDPKRKQQAIDDIQAFIDGKQKGVKLAERPRWEKVFPFLRRVEVTLHLDAATHDVKESSLPGGCEPEDLAYAKTQMPPLPANRRIPKESCDPRAKKS